MTTERKVPLAEAEAIVSRLDEEVRYLESVLTRAPKGCLEELQYALDKRKKVIDGIITEMTAVTITLPEDAPIDDVPIEEPPAEDKPITGEDIRGVA